MFAPVSNVSLTEDWGSRLFWEVTLPVPLTVSLAFIWKEKLLKSTTDSFLFEANRNTETVYELDLNDWKVNFKLKSFPKAEYSHINEKQDLKTNRIWKQSFI